MEKDKEVVMKIKINEKRKNDFLKTCADLGFDADTANSLLTRALQTLELEIKKQQVEKLPVRFKKDYEPKLAEKLRREILNLARAFGKDEVNGTVIFDFRHPDRDSHIYSIRAEFILDLENPGRLELRLGRQIRGNYEREIWKIDQVGEIAILIKMTPDGLISLSSPQEFEETISELLKLIETRYIQIEIESFGDLYRNFPASGGESFPLKKDQEMGNDQINSKTFSTVYSKDNWLIRISCIEDKAGDLIECRIREDNFADYDKRRKVWEWKEYRAIKRADKTGVTDFSSLEFQLEEKSLKQPATTKTISGYDFFQKFQTEVKEAERELPRKYIDFDRFKDWVDYFLKKCKEKKNLRIRMVSMNKGSESEKISGYYYRLLGATPYGQLIEIVSGEAKSVEFFYLRTIYFEKDDRIETDMDVAPLFAMKRKREDYLDWETGYFQYPGGDFDEEYSEGGEAEIREFPNWLPFKFEDLAFENVQNQILGADNITPKKFEVNFKKMINSLDWEIFTAEDDELLISSDKPEEIIIQSFEEEQDN